MKRIYFVRHGETDWNRTRRIQGSEIDTELNATGRIQATQTGKYLRQYGPFDLVMTSPLQRATETASLICTELGYDRHVLHNDALIEKNYGCLNGKTPEETEMIPEYQDVIAKWKNISNPIERMGRLSTNEEEQYRAFGIETTETIKARCAKILDYIAASPATNVLVVTHGYV